MEMTSKECDLMIAICSILTILLMLGSLVCFFLMRFSQLDIFNLVMLSMAFMISAFIGMVVTLFLLFFMEPTR